MCVISPCTGLVSRPIHGSRRLRLLEFLDSRHKVVSHTHRPPLPPRKIPGTHYLTH